MLVMSLASCHVFIIKDELRQGAEPSKPTSRKLSSDQWCFYVAVVNTKVHGEDVSMSLQKFSNVHSYWIPIVLNCNYSNPIKAEWKTLEDAKF
jgi:hypothetical protein